MPKFHTTRGFLTKYAHTCGYLDTATVGNDDRAIIMGHEGAVYFVQCHCITPRIWDTFDDDSAGRKAAHKRFMQLVREHKATRKWCDSAYGDKRDYPKIALFADGQYFASTTWSRTCRDAIRHAQLIDKSRNVSRRITAGRV